MNRAKKKSLFLSTVFLLVTVLIVYLSLNWYYLPFIYKDYGRDYNTKRVDIGQPLIEDYFVAKFPDGKRRQIWLTPDSMREDKIHWSKNYNTVKGELVVEVDFFVLNRDSIKYVIERKYFYENDSLSIGLQTKKSEKIIESVKINKEQYDSLLLKWNSLVN